MGPGETPDEFLNYRDKEWKFDHLQIQFVISIRMINDIQLLCT
jgi:hypothetical protein